MGVHGLASWVNRHSSLGDTVILSSDDDREPISLVVDGLAFLYHTAMDNESVRGGNYAAYRRLLKTYVCYWRSCRLEPIFVFDGPSNSSKTATILSRADQALAKSVKYFRSSDEERSQPHMQRIARKLPPLTKAAALAQLSEDRVTVYNAEEEADSPTAELAERLHGFVLSNDSDYFIFNANHRGYAPLQDVRYGGEGGKSYLTIHDNSLATAIRFRVYHHSKVARLLNIPPSFLPVLAALIGNDLCDVASRFVLPFQSRPIYPGQMDGQTIERIARALSSLQYLGPAGSSQTRESVMLAALAKLAPTPLEAVLVNDLWLSAESYNLCRIETASSTFPLHPVSEDSVEQASVRAVYLAASASGRFGGQLLSILKNGVYRPPSMLEDPDFASPSVTFGRPLRQWIYAILAQPKLLTRGAIVEVVRKQDVSVAVAIDVPSLSTLVSPSDSARYQFDTAVALSSPEARLAIYLAAFRWPASAMLPASTLPSLPLLLSLRHIRSLGKRPWSSNELLSALVPSIILSCSSDPPPTPSRRPKAVPKHYIQRSAELVQTLVHASILAQALLLTEVLPGVHTLFDGGLMHGFFEVDAETVLKGLPVDQQSLVQDMLSVVVT